MAQRAWRGPGPDPESTSSISSEEDPQAYLNATSTTPFRPGVNVSPLRQEAESRLGGLDLGPDEPEMNDPAGQQPPDPGTCICADPLIDDEEL